MAVFGPELQLLKLSSATCDNCSLPPPLSFLLKLCVVVPLTHRYHPPKFQPNTKEHDRFLIFAHFARVACLLLAAAAAAAAAAKPGRSTLDTKKGYKTKIGSTSSVTLTLTLTALIPFWYCVVAHVDTFSIHLRFYVALYICRSYVVDVRLHFVAT